MLGRGGGSRLGESLHTASQLTASTWKPPRTSLRRAEPARGRRRTFLSELHRVQNGNRGEAGGIIVIAQPVRIHD